MFNNSLTIFAVSFCHPCEREDSGSFSSPTEEKANPQAPRVPFLSLVCCFHLANRPICKVGMRGASLVIR